MFLENIINMPAIVFLLLIDAIWMLYGVFIKLMKKRKYDYSFFVSFLVLLVIGYFYFYKDYSSIFFQVTLISVPILFLGWILIDNLVLLFKKNVNEFDFYNLEKQIADLSKRSENMRQKFISILELSDQGIAFRENGNIFGTDQYIDYLGFKENEFKIEQFNQKIHKDDMHQYNNILDKLSKRNPVYNIKYRVNNNGRMLWINETGKLVIIDKKKTIISIVKPMDIRLYPESDVDTLNTMKNFKNMFDEMQRLTRKKTAYHLIIIQLTNIPQINQKYGRDFGDLMMGEYLSKLRFKFIKDNNSLFRISGIKFGLIIKDDRKYKLLDRALTGTGELLKLKMQFGGVTQSVYPNLGLSESPYSGKNPDKVYQEANKALSVSLEEKFESSFCFYDKL
ncbi:MAG: diguanylate cyclase [Candidatus Izimaplasma sp.]|nr:diguanylate cyclase [Candidatus Izimaplasma bacterium]